MFDHLDDDLTDFEADFLDHGEQVLTEALEVMHAINIANLTGEPVWRWGTGDPFEAIEAARAMRAFPIVARPNERPSDAV